ncbi:hypothetical protein [Vallitalea okinawensis]|uniref:hypothetical protein n=1 Tax=Vallitalea okinawensis TaxID=2078660 RepID=UPI000CFDA61A|nr:hypothetical protein [Vallitalea okinawensis]
MEEKIMAVSIGERVEKAPGVQEVLTDNGCIIKTRLGLHDDVGQSCANNGLLLLHIQGETEEVNQLHSNLKNIDGVGVNMMDVNRC